ncbi:MAG: flocculation-associated PEP-CTERM protein PepA, partial [Deltaproteobacteria bacterium]|nr:flocculation-associated PEP-CTERM protein PepA [Deltaproteobacteria bacterium]
MKSKKLMSMIVVGLLLVPFLAVGSASASVIELEDWQFNPSGAIGGLPGVFFPVDEITIIGTAYVDHNGIMPGPNVPFTETGAFAATGFQNNAVPILPGITGLGVSYELTGVFTASGVNTVRTGTNQEFIFTVGTLDIYLDTALDYGFASPAAPPFYGANNGVLIASFLLATGSGNLDFATVTGGDGRVDILFIANPAAAGLTNGLLPGVWFDQAGVDLSTYPWPDAINVALVDTNNNVMSQNELAGAPNIIPEWSEYLGFGAVPNIIFDQAGNPIGISEFYTRSDGSYRPGVVP